MTVPVIEESSWIGHTTYGNSATVDLSLLSFADGDYALIISAADYTRDPSIDATSISNGWVAHLDSAGASNSNVLLVWGKEYSTGDANPGWEIVAGNEPLGSLLLRISGWDNSISFTGPALSNGTTNAPTAPAATTTDPDALVFRIASIDDGGQTVLTTPSTQLLSVAYGGGSGFRLGVSTEEKATAGSTGTAAFSSVDTEQSSAGTLAIYGVGGGGGGYINQFMINNLGANLYNGLIQ